MTKKGKQLSNILFLDSNAFISYVVWTNFDSDNQSSHLVKVHANPEVVRNQTDTSGSFSVHAITMSNSTETKSEFWALGADYNNKVRSYPNYIS